MVTGSREPQEPTTRRVGRPRLRPADAHAPDPREQILGVAAELFSRNGYSATSTREIAETVGVRQASLFHHFEHKEDILAELLDRTLRPALALSIWLEHERIDPFIALYVLSYFDSSNLCSSANNIAGLQLLPEAKDPRFSAFWEDRSALRSGYRQHILRANARTSREIDLCTDLVFGLVESVLTWFDPKGLQSADTVAGATAEAALRIVGTPARQQARIARSARETLGRYSERA